MTVEIASYVGQLNTASPPGSDPMAEGDDHIRLIKQALQNTFPNATAAWESLPHTWGAPQSISIGTALTGLTLTSTNDTASAGPAIALVRNSPTPAINDVIGLIAFQGRDNLLATLTYAQIYATILDPLSTSNQATLNFTTMQDNALTATMQLFGATLRITSTDDLAVREPVLDLFRDSASPAASDYIGGVTFSGRRSDQVYVRYAHIDGLIEATGVGTFAGQLRFGVAEGGASSLNELILTATALTPAVASGLTLGTALLPYAHMFLDNGGVIDWENNSARITYSTTGDVLTIQGANLGVTGNTTISGNTTIVGNATISGTTLTVNANESIVGNLTQSGGVVSFSSATIADATALQIVSGTLNGLSHQVLSLIITGAASVNERFVRFGDQNGLMGSIVSTGGSGVKYNETSDARLKENIRDLDDSGALVDALRPRQFTWRNGGQADLGFIAQEVHPVVPTAVTVGGDDPREQPWMMQKGALEAILVAEIKSLRARVAVLEASNA